MFRVSPTPIIMSRQTVVTTTGTSHEFEDKVRQLLIHGLFLMGFYLQIHDLYQ